jgi:hypothetical protein
MWPADPPGKMDGSRTTSPRPYRAFGTSGRAYVTTITEISRPLIHLTGPRALSLSDRGRDRGKKSCAAAKLRAVG